MYLKYHLAKQKKLYRYVSHHTSSVWAKSFIDEISVSSVKRIDQVKTKLERHQMRIREGGGIDAAKEGGGDDGAFEELRISSSSEPFVLELKEVGDTTIKNTIVVK